MQNALYGHFVVYKKKFNHSHFCTILHRLNLKRPMKKLLIVFIALVLFSSTIYSQTTVKKVVLQAFWWDYHNNAYTHKWCNYLTELAPRLKSMGIDAVWIPPSSKNESPSYVGYAPFDHYDLGDKYQKGNTNTRLGTKEMA
jgi:hypothetical protein